MQSNIFKPEQTSTPVKAAGDAGNTPQVQEFLQELTSLRDSSVESKNFESHMPGEQSKDIKREDINSEVNLDDNTLSLASVNLPASEQIPTRPLQTLTDFMTEPALKTEPSLIAAASPKTELPPTTEAAIKTEATATAEQLRHIPAQNVPELSGHDAIVILPEKVIKTAIAQPASEAAKAQPSHQQITPAQQPIANPSEDIPLHVSNKPSAHPSVPIDPNITLAPKVENQQNGTAARLTDGAHIQAPVLGDNGDIKLTEQRMMDKRELTPTMLDPDNSTKSPPLFGERIVAPAVTSTLSLAPDAASFALTSLTPSPLSIAGPQTLSPHIQALNTPSFTSVSQSIAKMVETQKGVSVRLDPPEMGRVYIDYQFEADRSVTAIVRADLPEALAQLRENTPLLQNLLKDSGFDQVNINFEQNTSDKDASNSDGHQTIKASRDSDTAIQASMPSPKAHAPLSYQNRDLNQPIDIKL